MDEKIGKSFVNGKFVNWDKTDSDELKRLKIELEQQEKLLLNKLNHILSQF